jgi:hypothetical protein
VKKTISHAHDIDDTHVFGFTQTLDHVHEHGDATILIAWNPRKLAQELAFVLWGGADSLGLTKEHNNVPHACYMRLNFYIKM